MAQIQAQSQQNPGLRLALTTGAAIFFISVLYFAYSDLTSSAAVAMVDNAVKGV